ncbi:MAG: transposase [Candidatus Hydrogenedentes bacterium]|nr:transposase [Candidatus Hydrogenedentota bacterium]
MTETLAPIFALAMEWIRPKYNAKMQFLEAQIQMLRRRQGNRKLRLTPKERAELLRLGYYFDHEIEDLIHVVHPETYRHWVRRIRRGKKNRRWAWGRITSSMRSLVVQMAVENPQWGYQRIFGEMKKLGYRISKSTIRNTLLDNGIHPSWNKSGKSQPIPWNDFVRANMESLIATDFFSKEITTWHGSKHAYIVFFMHLGTRRVYCSLPTFSPDEEWVEAEARKASAWLIKSKVKARYLVRDRDSKYTGAFEAFWTNLGVRSIKIPPKAPNVNGFAESFIGKLRRECLNHFLCFSPAQFNHILQTWLRYYHEERPHGGIGMGNTVPDLRTISKPVRDEGEVFCREKLGGLIKFYTHNRSEATDADRQVSDSPENSKLRG